MDKQLVKTLQAAGQPTVEFLLADGAQALVLPRGGRILGLYASGSQESFLWTNPALAMPGTAKGFFERTSWINPGGDRTWLGPEMDLFISDLAHPWETYAVQAALDPGNWRLDYARETEVCLVNTTRVRLYRIGQDVNVQLRKLYRPAANPLPVTGMAAGGLQYAGGLLYAGYTQVTTVELEPLADATVQLGIWNLLQLPQPGAMLIPTQMSTQPQLLFGTLPAGDLTVTPSLVCWNMNTSGKTTKIALKAGALTGRAGHLRQAASPGLWDLVVREFAVVPGGNYVDALWDEPNEAGWVFQACGVRAGNENFNELEYHAPAAMAVREQPAVVGQNTSQDESHVWAFRGPAEAIDGVARRLLNVSVMGMLQELE